MGLDYIRRQSGKPFYKKWDKGLDRLKQFDLLDHNTADAKNSAAAKIQPGYRLCPGQEVCLVKSGEGLTIIIELKPVGKIENPPASMTDAISDCGGIALGTIEHSGIFGDTAEVSIKK